MSVDTLGVSDENGFTNYNSATVIRQRYDIKEKTDDPEKDYVSAPIGLFLFKSLTCLI